VTFASVALGAVGSSLVRRLVAIVVVPLALMSMPAAARADTPAAWQRKALETAQRVWHPACGGLSIAFADPASFDIVTINGTRTADAAGWGSAGDCQIDLAQGRTWDGYPEFCTVVLHEVGHVVGHDDTTGPGIMNSQRIIAREVGRSARRDGRWGAWRVDWPGADHRCIRPMDRVWRYVRRDGSL
jgi:hypothetical protein